MLENYIERNIFRKVYLCEQLFEFQEIDIEQTAISLRVTTPTILHDLESLAECLEYCIKEQVREKHKYKLVFKHGIALSELTQFLYGQSYFLKFLSYYFNGIFTSTELADLEFISLSKVYTIKKIVLDFFKENDYLKNKEIIIPEFDSRNILLDWAFEQTAQPVAIRIPTHGVEHGTAIANDYSIPAYQTVNNGGKVAILALGGFLELGKETVKAFRKKGIEATLINPGTITENDVETLDKLKETHELVITLEDGSLSGGFGENISRYYGDSSMNVLNFGAEKEFTDSVPVGQLYERYHLTPKQIVEDSLRVFNIQ